MSNENYNRFKFLWDAYEKLELEYTQTTERYFFETLKLVISLSTALLAFIVVLYDKITINFCSTTILKVVGGLLVSLFCAFLASALLAIHYKKYTDDMRKNRQSVFCLYSKEEHEKIIEIYKQDQQKFLSAKDAGWQWITIFFGGISWISFGGSVFFLISKILFQAFAF